MLGASVPCPGAGPLYGDPSALGQRPGRLGSVMHGQREFLVDYYKHRLNIAFLFFQ
jgi:hypothetical protein